MRNKFILLIIISSQIQILSPIFINKYTRKRGPKNRYQTKINTILYTDKDPDKAVGPLQPTFIKGYNI